MDLDAAITIVLVALMVISPLLMVVLIVMNGKLKRRLNEMKTALDEMESRVDKRLGDNENALKDELAKQRRMLSESLASINDNVTRGVIDMTKGKK